VTADELAQLIYGGLTGATLATVAAGLGHIRQAIHRRRQDELATDDGWITVKELRARAALKAPAGPSEPRCRAVLLAPTQPKVTR
jgi:hypothetical protein